MSLTLLYSETTVKAVTINRQLIGESFLFAPHPFVYCGNEVPGLFSKLNRSSLNPTSGTKNLFSVVKELPLSGLVGVDFILRSDGGVFVLEVNPRVPGSLQCSEMALDTNLMSQHLQASKTLGLPPFDVVLERDPPYCATKYIVYSPKVIKKFQQGWIPFQSQNVVAGLDRGYYDVPHHGQRFGVGDPLFTIYTRGKTKIESNRYARDLLARFLKSSGGFRE